MRAKILIGAAFLFGVMAHAQPASARTPHSELRTDFRSVADAARSFERLGQRLQARGDLRGLFPRLFAVSVRNTGTKIEQGAFHHPRWVTDVVIKFANLYRVYLERELAGQREGIPAAWQVQLAQTRAGSADRAALFGIHAHVGLDLVETLMTIPTDFHDEKMRADFLLIGDIVVNGSPDAWRVVDSFRAASVPSSPIALGAANAWLIRLRAQCWGDAERASRLSRRAQREFLQRLDRSVAAVSSQYGILLPLAPTRYQR